MTIREYIKGRAVLVRYLSFGWIVFPMVPIFAFPERAKTSWIAWLAIGYVLMAAVRYAIAWQTKCPRCGTSLLRITMGTAGGSFVKSADACPQCGVGFDEPLESPANAK